MLGLKQGVVQLLPHQILWDNNAKNTILLLKTLFGKTAIDIQHIGSTSIHSIHSKPIIDIVVGVKSLELITPCIEKLNQHGIIFRGQDVRGQLLFIIGNMQNCTRTHHIHIVQWKSNAWNNYIYFRDYLNAFPEKAKEYDKCKQKLALQFPDDRKSYTKGKQQLIYTLLREARLWKERS